MPSSIIWAGLVRSLARPIRLYSVEPLRKPSNSLAWWPSAGACDSRCERRITSYFEINFDFCVKKIFLMPMPVNYVIEVAIKHAQRNCNIELCILIYRSNLYMSPRNSSRATIDGRTACLATPKSDDSKTDCPDAIDRLAKLSLVAYW